MYNQMDFYAFCASLSDSRDLTFISEGWDLQVHAVKRAALIAVEIIISRSFNRQNQSKHELCRSSTITHDLLWRTFLDF